MNIYTYIENSSRQYPDKASIIFKDQEISYKSLTQHVDQIASGLQDLGIEKGQKVAIWGWNSPEWVFAFYAAIKIGAIVVPIIPELKKDEVSYIVNHSESENIFLDPRLSNNYPEIKSACPSLKNGITFGDDNINQLISLKELSKIPPSAPDAAARRPEDLVAIYYTSGTTGKPKGVYCTHGHEEWALRSNMRNWGYTENDKMLCCIHLAFVYGSIMTFTSCLFSGGTAILLEKFHPAIVLQEIECHKATVFLGVPTMWFMMLNYEEKYKYDISSLRFVGSSGATLPWLLCQQFKNTFGVNIFDFLGLTEARPLIGYYQPGPHVEPKPNALGLLYPEVEAKIVNDEDQEVEIGEVGELIVRGPCVTSGYYKDAEANSNLIRNGWCYTADMVKKDSDGYFYYVDRKRDLIIRGGINISPLAIEEVIREHPDVSEVAVIGIPDSAFGEQIKACIVPKPSSSLTAKDIELHCQKHLAEYKIPKYIEFMDCLPRNPQGKILKRALREAAIGKNKTL